MSLGAVWALFNVGRLLVEVVLLVVLATLLPVAHVRWYVAVSLVLQVCMYCMSVSGVDAALVRAVATVAYIAVPFLFFEAKFAQRFVAVALGFMFLVLGELLASVAWMFMTGMPVADVEAVAAHPMEMALTFLLDMLTVVCCGLLFRRPMKRWVSGDGFRGASLSWFIVFPALQTAMVVIALILTLDYLGGDRSLYLFLTTYACACMAVDVLLFVSAERYCQAVIQDQRAAVLAERLDACLAEYAGVVAQVERAAALRHDLRNHLQVVGALLERGELARAEGYVENMVVRM